MKVLSLLQPWASLVVMGAKKIETRSWNTKHRGPLLIHASLGKTGSLFALEPPFTKYISDFKSLPFGAIIGQANLEDVLPILAFNYTGDMLNRLTFEERAFGDYGEGRFGWLLTDPVVFEKPIAARGHLHLWEYEGEVEGDNS